MTAAHRKHILITGATSGIGLILSGHLARRHDLILVGRRPHEEVEALLPAGCPYIEADQTVPQEAVRQIADGLLRLGRVRLDHAVLNAGIGFAAQYLTEPPAQIRQTLDVNLTALILTARVLYPWLEKAAGTLTLIGSVARHGAEPFPAYAASKAGLDGFGRSLQAEWRGRVTVQVLHPGPTRTGMQRKAGFDPGHMERLFIPTKAMARMVEAAMASPRPMRTLSFGRYLSGGAMFARRL